MAFIKSDKFLSLINGIPDGVIISNEKGEIIQINQQACLLTGYSRQQILKLVIEDLVPTNKEKHIKLRKKYFKDPRPRILGERVIGLSFYCFARLEVKFFTPI